jgi:serine/threonine-protein kinase
MVRYQRIKEINGGGQARIFWAYDALTRRQVILKTPKSDNPGTRRRLRREARLLNEQQQNPFVIDLEADHSNESPPFIAVEYCVGGSLFHWVANRRSVVDVASAIQHAAFGLQGIHDLGGFHRDPTPRNLVIAFDREGCWRVKLIDLGLGQTPNPQSGTMTKSYAGTPGYIAPEIEAGDDYTWRADIYTLGIVFRELLTGHKEYRFVLFNAPPPFLVALISQMTASDPQLRPSTRYICSQLQAFLSNSNRPC